MNLVFHEIFKKYMQRDGRSKAKLHKQSDVPLGTLKKLPKKISEPNNWENILKLAKILRRDTSGRQGLTYFELNALLRSTRRYQSLPSLYHEQSQRRELFSPWQKEIDKVLNDPYFNVPRRLSYFVGREREMGEILERLIEHELCIVQGKAGCGKTELVKEFAYRMRTCFPDGVFWFQIVEQSDLMSILYQLAAAFGCADEVAVYTDFASRCDFVRRILRDKQALIVFDGAQSRHQEQIEALLPPTLGNCFTIITTRSGEFTFDNGADQLRLGPFRPEDTRSYLDEYLPKEEDDTLFKIVEELGHLPLVIALCVSLINRTPTLSLAGLLIELRQKLEIESKIEALFDLIYNTLPEREKRCFSVLGVFGGEDFSVEAVGAVAKRSTKETEEVLGELSCLSVHQTTEGRYALHPLLRDYASKKMSDSQPSQQMVKYYVKYVEKQKINYAALDREVNNIQTALKVADERNMLEEFIAGINGFYYFLNVRGYYQRATPLLEQAKKKVEALSASDLRLASLLPKLARIAEKQGNYAEAQGYYIRALTLAQGG